MKSSPCFLLFLVFLVLKLTDVIGCSWWWVTAPLWGAFALLVVGCISVAAVGVIVEGRKTTSQKAMHDYSRALERSRR